MRKRITTIAVVLLVAIAAGATLWWWLTPDWPEFPEASTSEPQVITQVERDYAHHIGDLIELHLFVKQHPGTTVDTRSLAVGGDFELNREPEVTSKEKEDGSVHYRMRLHIQSFVAKPELKLYATFGWQGEGDRQEVTIPPVSLFWSNTYDGRPALMEGDDPRVSPYWYYGRHVIPLAVSSILFLILTGLALRSFLRSRRSQIIIDRARLRVEEIFATVQEGSCSKADYLELDGLVREHWEIGPIPAGSIELERTHTPPFVTRFLKLNEQAVYAEGNLEDGDRQQLAEFIGVLLTHWDPSASDSRFRLFRLR